MKQTKFTEKELPYEAFERLGFSKMDIYRFEKKELEALLNGKRTALKKISTSIEGKDGEVKDLKFNAKFSLKRKADNSVELYIHPVRKQIHDDIGLNERDKEKLLHNQIISKIKDGERYLVQLDKDTNELLRVNVKNITFPNYILDVKLTDKQKEDIRAGKIVTLVSQDKNVHINLDLNSSRGLVVLDDLSLKKKMDYDRLNPKVVGFVQTDRNSFEFTTSLKKNNHFKQKI